PRQFPSWVGMARRAVRAAFSAAQRTGGGRWQGLAHPDARQIAISTIFEFFHFLPMKLRTSDV
ncbi:MAG: hypothetical protein ABI651_15475, partial [Verrucomicrobiota bacterium]